jgi:hypothetical protein
MFSMKEYVQNNNIILDKVVLVGLKKYFLNSNAKVLIKVIKRLTCMEHTIKCKLHQIDV